MFRGLSCYTTLIKKVKANLLLRGCSLDYDLRQINPQIDGENFAKEILKSSTMADGTINGAILSALNFPLQQHYDVFISYSHDDEETAKVLFLLLTRANISCFLDSTIWHSADTLLKEIDDRYSLSSGSILDAKYDYTKRNYSTSHVHAMLSMAMLEAIDRSDLCIFLKSENSISLKEGIEQGTLSPWIYEEQQYIGKIEPRNPNWFPNVRERLFDSAHRVANENLKVVYPITGPSELMNERDFAIISGSRGRDCLKEIYVNHKFIENQI